jgi:hypothetical protein
LAHPQNEEDSKCDQIVSTFRDHCVDNGKLWKDGQQVGHKSSCKPEDTGAQEYELAILMNYIIC